MSTIDARTPPPSETDVAVVGGGLAGWTAAAVAARAGARTLVLEPRADGGRAGADRHGDLLLHRGPHALAVEGPGASVARRLGADLDGVPPPARGALGLLRGGVGLLPQGPGSLLRTSLLTVPERVRLPAAARRLSATDPAAVAHLTVAEWFDELGLDGGVRAVASMLARLATYTADLEVISADVLADRLRLGGVRYLHRGFAGFVDDVRAAALAAGATSVPVRVRTVRPTDGGAVLGVGEVEVRARAVVLAVGTPAAAAALVPAPPSGWLAAEPGPTVACLDLGLDAVPVGAPVLLGLDEPAYLIRHAPPARLAPPGGAVVHAARYLGRHERHEPRAGRASLEALARRVGIEPDRAVVARYLHRMSVAGSTPTPGTGGLAGRPEVSDPALPGVLVAGDWVGPTGYLADAALVSAERAGRAAAELAARRRRPGAAPAVR